MQMSKILVIINCLKSKMLVIINCLKSTVCKLMRVRVDVYFVEYLLINCDDERWYADEQDSCNH